MKRNQTIVHDFSTWCDGMLACKEKEMCKRASVVSKVKYEVWNEHDGIQDDRLCLKRPTSIQTASSDDVS